MQVHLILLGHWLFIGRVFRKCLTWIASKTQQCAKKTELSLVGSTKDTTLKHLLEWRYVFEWYVPFKVLDLEYPESYQMSLPSSSMSWALGYLLTPFNCKDIGWRQCLRRKPPLLLVLPACISELKSWESSLAAASVMSSLPKASSISL